MARHRVTLGAAAAAGGLVFLLLWTMHQSHPEVWGSILLTLALVVVSIPIFAAQARRESNPTIFWLLVAALVFHLLGGIVRFYLPFILYGFPADAGVYHMVAVEASSLAADGDLEGALRVLVTWRGDPARGISHLTGTNFIPTFASVIYLLIGSNYLGGFLVFAWLGFWGSYLLYRAFTIAVPNGRSLTYARLLFFLPSMLYWPSGLGKEAWMLLSIGLAAYGAARFMCQRLWSGAAFLVSGIAMASLVRIHMGLLLAIATIVGFILIPVPLKRKWAAVTVKAAVIGVVIATAFILWTATEDFLASRRIETSKGLAALLETTTIRTTTESGSDFEPVTIGEPSDVPLAAFTVLFRPMVHEAHNIQALVAALEGTFLVTLMLFRIRWLGAALRSLRRTPYIAYALTFTALFVIAFSSFANFGLLSRQRAQVLPFLLVLLAVPPTRRRWRAR